MIEVGKINKLWVCHLDRTGYKLKNEEADREVFMPAPLAPANLKLNQKLAGFVYPDKDGQLIATKKVPHAVVGEYALLTAVNVQPFGAFFDWGVERDLLIPNEEQKEPVKLNQRCLVRVCHDEASNQIYGTTKVAKHIQASNFDIVVGEKVKVRPVSRDEFGYRVVVNRKFVGIIYHNEIFTEVKIGDWLDGRVKNIREDGLVDAALQSQGISKLVDAKRRIMETLRKNGGTLSLHDKSDPQAIKQVLGMSKSTFKAAVGMLYKERAITMTQEGIGLRVKK